LLHDRFRLYLVGTVSHREWLMPLLRERMASRAASEIAASFEQAGLPYAPIRAPHEMVDDAHLQATGGLAPMQLPDGRDAKVPLLPLMLDQQRLPLRRSPPRLGADTDELVARAGYTAGEIAALRAAGVVG
jgi:crotonobetainyl-CoA:carnitine CoA-transferase CaiB-like acyl-CoA transferase